MHPQSQRRVYLNCAATSVVRPPCVTEAVVRALGSLGSSGRGAGGCELGAARAVMVARERVCRLFNGVRPERVVMCANATMALNLAILGTVRPGDHVVATAWDHNSVLRPLFALRDERGVSLDVVGADERGALDLDELARLVTPGTRLVTCTHASNLTGDVCDVGAVARIAHDAGALLLVDCAQTAGARPVDMQALGADLLAFTGHKALMAPQGTGGLIARPGVEVMPTLRGGTGVRSFDEGMPEAWPEHLEAGTLNAHGIAGLSAALAWLDDLGVERVHRHDLALVRRFAKGVRSLEGCTLYGGLPRDLALLDGSRPERDHAPVLALNVRGWESSALALALEERHGISVRAGAHCAPLMHRALGTSRTGAVRFSFGWFTSDQDVDYALDALGRLAREA
ncbi:aminotransferase class V-fold PLP-dependent enzyme [Olsenella massiliensis]|uniref:aminotransferase class V-fold PLP-dependent enzyme n=1 Tax=Olsenella massiliensis TaxID=1622075 RepID=UPI00071E11AF|nr:aminotransferase class V-fold PLP-dependent enzyme [Olsenella massiliensis]